MAKLFSVTSWNVEHFKGDAQRVTRVVGFLSGMNGGPPSVPDIFVLFEVEGKDIYQEFMNKFTQHRFHMTEGKQTQEIFIGVHRDIQTFSTQRLEFKTQREFQRPGLLLSLRAGGQDYSLLFLHIRSGDNTEDFGLRDAALIHAFNLKKALDVAYGGKANFIFLGDLNTMGIDDPVPYYKEMDLSWEKEVERIKFWAGKRDMVLLTKEKTVINGKEKEVTWYNGSSSYVPTGLDHVIASDHLDIRSYGNASHNVTVLGWPKLPPSQWSNWFA